MSMKASGFNKSPKYNDGLTKQSFKDESDINKILHRAQKAGTMSHLEKYQGSYSDFSDFDFLDAQVKLTEGRQIFDALPSEIRNEFKNSQAAFFEYVNDSANVDKLNEKLPGLSAPGRQNIDVSSKTPPESAVSAESTPPAYVTPTPDTPEITPTEATPAV